MKTTDEQSAARERAPSPGAGPASRSAEQPNELRPGRPPRRLSPAAARSLQASAGNRAVARLVAQRRAAAEAPAATGPAPAAATGPVTASAAAPTTAPAGAEPVLGAPRDPHSDPKFVRLIADVRGKQKTMSAHPPATTAAAAAQGAAKPPADDKIAQGKAANAEKMNAAQPGAFDKAAFIAAVNQAIAAQAPKNLDEADHFADSGKAGAIKGAVQGKVTEGKKASANQITTTTNAPPDTAAAKDKPVTPLAPDQPPGVPATPDPNAAVPDKLPPSATDLSAGPAQVDKEMADAQVTEPQLANANEPEFTAALAAKKDGEAHAAAAPPQMQAKEAQTLAAARSGAAAAGATAMAGLAADRKAAGAAVHAGQEGAKGSDEAKRAQVTATLQRVFDATKADVEAILTGLDKKVDESFTAGEKAARDAFTAEHKRRMDAYKDARYSGFTGKLRWVKDKFAGLPEEANQIFVVARQGYVTRMQTVISNVADVIGAELTKAKTRIATGRNELAAAVNKLPAELQAIGKDAANGFSAKFDELGDSVDAKGNELVQTLASRYTDAVKAVDAEIEAEKEKNRGLVAKAVSAVKGVVDTILKLKDLLLGILAKAASAVMAILKDPIGFLGKLVHAVGQGLRQFLERIGIHLNKGLMAWLLGAMTGAGLMLPPRFDIAGIFLMVASLLGLTWSALRGRAVAKGVPEPVMGTVESSMPAAKRLATGGPTAMFEETKDQVGDLKGNLFGKITQYLIPTVLIAGITWIISLLNPASAFIKACKMIIDIVQFIVTRGAQIVMFVNAVLDAIIAIAGGGSGGVPNLIENALALSIPVLIGALAAILGIGGIADKVKGFFQTLTKPVMKAVDWVIDKIVAFGKKLWAKLKSKFGKNKDGKPTDPAAARQPVTPKPIELAVNMRGQRHTLRVTPGRAPRMASMEGEVKAKLAAATESLKGRDPDSEEELNALIQIEELDTKLKTASDDLARLKNAEAQSAFENAAQALKAAIQAYASRFDRSDLAAITDQVTIRQALARATHEPASSYRKHVRGTTDQQRQDNSRTAGQFKIALNDARIAELERDTLLNGEIVNRGGGTFHVYKQHGELLGWNGGPDKEAYWLRAEITGVDEKSATPGGSIHSHPRASR